MLSKVLIKFEIEFDPKVLFNHNSLNCKDEYFVKTP